MRQICIYGEGKRIAPVFSVRNRNLLISPLMIGSIQFPMEQIANSSIVTFPQIHTYYM